MSQPAAALPQRPKHSGRGTHKLELVRSGDPSNGSLDPTPPSTARPDLHFQVEPFHAIARELPPLFLRHWEELAVNKDAVPLDPDWDRFFLLAAEGKLAVMTMRAGDALVGYIFNLVGPHLHYRGTLHAQIDMFWLDPSYRGTWTTMRWFRANDDMLRGLGGKRVLVGVKNHFMAGRSGSIFRRLGYRPTDTVWAKVL